MNFKVKKGKGVRGEITIPGDKSISHSSIMCSSLAEGKSKIYGFLEGEDCLATKLAFQDMGINFETNNDEIVVHGSGLYGLNEPKKEISINTSGTYTFGFNSDDGGGIYIDGKPVVIYELKSFSRLFFSPI